VVARACCTAVGLPTTAVLDTADLLDVEVDQVARCGSFVAQRGRLRGSDGLAGQWVTLAQVGNVVAAQDGRDRHWCDTELGTDPVLSASLGAA